MDWVVPDVVHGAAELGGLSGDYSCGLGIYPRQPGEGRNLRVGHSVGDQNLFPLGVIADPPGIPDHLRYLP